MTVFIISGPQGSGKTTIAERLVSKNAATLRPSQFLLHGKTAVSQSPDLIIDEVSLSNAKDAVDWGLDILGDLVILTNQEYTGWWIANHINAKTNHRVVLISTK